MLVGVWVKGVGTDMLCYNTFGTIIYLSKVFYF